MPRRKIDWYGPRLRELREQAGLSQAELGQRVEVAGSQINKLETNVNQPTLATALAIAEALNLSIAAFIVGKPNGKPPERSPSKDKAGAATVPKRSRGRPK